MYPFHRNLGFFYIARSLFLIALVFYFAKLVQSNNLVSFIYIYICNRSRNGYYYVLHTQVYVCVFQFHLQENFANLKHEVFLKLS